MAKVRFVFGKEMTDEAMWEAFKKFAKEAGFETKDTHTKTKVRNETPRRSKKMLIEIKPKGNVEYRGQSPNGRILTIEKQGKGYMVRSYQIKCNDLLKEPVDWEGAFKVFQTLSKRRDKSGER